MDINKDKVLKAGVSLNDIYTTVGAFLGGSYVNDFNRFGRLIQGICSGRTPEYRLNEEQVNTCSIVKNTANGESVPLVCICKHIKDIAGPDLYQSIQSCTESVELTVEALLPGLRPPRSLDCP